MSACWCSGQVSQPFFPPNRHALPCLICVSMHGCAVVLMFLYTWLKAAALLNRIGSGDTANRYQRLFTVFRTALWAAWSIAWLMAIPVTTTVAYGKPVQQASTISWFALQTLLVLAFTGSLLFFARSLTGILGSGL